MTPTICGTTYDGLPGRRRRRRPGPHRRRQDPAPGDRGRRRRRPHRGRRRGHRQRPQGHQPARAWPSASRAVGEGRGGPALGARGLRRLHRPVVRALGQRRRPGARDHARGGRPPARHRQDREAAGDRQPRRGRSRPSTASWWRAATSAWSARWSEVPLLQKLRGREGPAQRQAGHRGHPDAGVDDLQPGADPGRGLRRRQRRAGRCRRGDAVGGDQRRASTPSRRSARWQRIVVEVEKHAPGGVASIDWQPRTRGGVIAKAAAEVAERVGAEVPRRLHPVRRLRPAAVAAARAGPDPGVHARGQGALASSP